MILKEFFVDENVTIPFKLFGKTHWFLMIMVFVGLILVYLNRKKINQLSLIIKRRIVVIFALLLFANMIILYISSFYYHSFDYRTMLPLHLCYLSNYFYLFAILFKKESLYPYLYFLAFLGPIPAIIFFDVPSCWESFNFYLYVISHHLLVIMGLFTFYLYPKKIEVSHMIKLFVVLNILYLFMKAFNFYFDTNYFFTGAIPSFIVKLLPFLQYLPVVVILEGMEILIMGGLYFFFRKQHSLLTG